MNKNLKKLIAITLAIGAMSAVAPVTNVNLLTTKAYAASNDTDTLNSLKLETTSGSTIKLYSDSDYASDNKVDSDSVEDGKTYYAKTSASTIDISTSGPSSKYVRIFKGTSSSAKGKKTSSDISLSADSTTTLTVRVYSEEPDSSITYDDDSYVSEYTIKVKCTASDSSDSSDNSNNYDDIYLSKLSISGESISLSKSQTTYNYSVASDVDSVSIKATPEDDNYTVTIDGSSVDDSDNYKKTVDLDKGENDIKVEIQDDSSDDRVYTLKITRGGTSSTTDSTSTSATTTASSTPNTATTVSTAKPNQWVQVNGKWQYNDSTGNPLKNTWVQNYYVDANGNMATGWINFNGSWYYLGNDGAKKTGWQLANGAWYYLDGEGRMQTGWMRDLTNGKYYYLNSNGTMASNTTIGGYKLGSDGAWIN
ncbi:MULTISPECIES: cadherin-like beta sandwich domain-containing protein [unclassified Clostridium]|uniref:N-acetylmuramoyl-L-alanine amidase family protein n=1 Tax=unclassified Clostridium TaxID=2614128 RepID=UPI0002980B7B|nr:MULTISPECIES: cadherin-like beta sandwich domain-containing protein [unclassified Clostridium]EKQ50549.1 MAG: putative cell wall binding protein [Clostridium sp. Maddingley MBC34-26]